MAEAQALDCDALKGRKVPFSASQSNVACRYVRRKQELLVFRAIAAFRCESNDSESDL